MQPLGYALTPQAFSISNLVLGLVPHCPDSEHYTTNDGSGWNNMSAKYFSFDNAVKHH